MEKIIKYYTKICCLRNKIKKQEDIDQIIDDNLIAFSKNNYDFKNFINISKYTKNKHSRLISKVKDKTALEFVLLEYLKDLLIKKSQIQFRTRQCIIAMLLDKLKIIKDLKEFTIVKFDFENFFNSISSQFVYEKYLSEFFLTKNENDLLTTLVKDIPYAFAGLPTSNIISEIIANDFDNTLKNQFNQNNIIFYARYVDDGILILNKQINEGKIKECIENALKEVFYSISNCKKTNKTKINYSTKFTYINQTNTSNEIGYLGYNITLTKNKKEIELGLTQEKINKYNKKFEYLIKKFYSKPELLKIGLMLWSRRITYTVKDKKDVKRWISKGLAHNYSELRNFEIDNRTKLFLNNAFDDVFQNNDITKPFFLSNSKYYSLLDNILNNKAFILDENIGIDKNALSKLVKTLDSTYDTKNKSYHDLIKKLLIEYKVGY